MPPPKESLVTLLNTTLTRLTEFSSFLAPTTPLTLPQQHLDNPPNPLHVLRDAARLTKAHTTKLSLLAITPPFTPSALATVIRQLSAESLPAMMSATQICEQEKDIWGCLMGGEVKARVRRVFREMTALLLEVQAIAGGRGGERSRDSLASTGVVWEACDALVELEALGVGGLAVVKAQQYRDTLRDAIEELRQWRDGEDEGNEGFDELLDEGDEGVEGDRDSMQDFFNAANSMPRDRPEIRGLVDEADGKLKKVVLLYTAVIKRRLKTFKSPPPTSETSESSQEAEKEETKKAKDNVRRLDAAMESLRRIPHQVDELAGCFYDLDEEKVKAALGKCIAGAVSAATVLSEGWDGNGDEFTAWSTKWRDAVG